jgi:hypothetical protein
MKTASGRDSVIWLIKNSIGHEHVRINQHTLYSDVSNHSMHGQATYENLNYTSSPIPLNSLISHDT